MSSNVEEKSTVPLGGQTLLTEYDTHMASYEEFRRICETLLAQLLRRESFSVHSVTSRLKTRKSLSAKLEREGKNYSSLRDVTDVVGLRVITHFEDEVDRIGTLIEREFAVDSDRSIDKRKALDPDRFGYLSLHYICGLNPARLRLAENRGCEGLGCEVQVRSILQHAWAEIEHDLGYKAAAILPPHIRRRFSRLAGMLEIADAEFSRLRDDIQKYSAQVASDLRPGKLTNAVQIDQISLREFIKKDLVLRAVDTDLARIMRSKLKGMIETVGTVGELRHVGLTTLEELRKALTERRVLLAHYWRKIANTDDRHSQLPHGVALWQLFQLMVAERGTLAATRQAFDLFSVGAPGGTLAHAKRLVRLVSAFRKQRQKRRTKGRSNNQLQRTRSAIVRPRGPRR